MKHLWLAVATAAIAVSVVIVWSFGTTPVGIGAGDDPHKQPQISIDMAKQFLLEAIGLVSSPVAGPVNYDGMQDRPGVRVYVLSVDGAQAYIDVSDGHVALMTLPKLVSDSPVQLTPDAAVSAARDYLQRLNSPVSDMDVSVEPGTGGGFPGYTVIFQRTASGVALPDYRIVEIDGTDGSLISLVDVRRPMAAILPPAVSEDKAIEAALAAFPGAHVSGIAQTVTFDRAGNQLQVWQVSLLPDDSTAAGMVVLVDTQTGSLVNLQR